MLITTRHRKTSKAWTKGNLKVLSIFIILCLFTYLPCFSHLESVRAAETPAQLVQGEIVEFGSYYNSKNSTDASEAPIEWIVLENTGTTLFLMTKHNIDAMAYDTATTSTWESSATRRWLNSYGGSYPSIWPGSEASHPVTEGFLNTAFTAAEQNAINTTTVTADSNTSYPSTPQGNATNDKVFSLSVNEALNPAYGFDPTYNAPDPLRITTATGWAKGMTTSLGGMYAGYTRYRTAGSSEARITFFNGSSNVDRGGGVTTASSSTIFGVRPAIKLNLTRVYFQSSNRLAAKISVGGSITMSNASAPNYGVTLGLSGGLPVCNSTDYEIVWYRGASKGATTTEIARNVVNYAPTVNDRGSYITAVATGKGAYTGSLTAQTTEKVKVPMSYVTVTVDNATYNGTEQKSSPSSIQVNY